MTDDINKRLLGFAKDYGISEIDIAFVVDDESRMTFHYRAFAWVESPFDGTAFTVKAEGERVESALDSFEGRLKDHLAMLKKWKEKGR